MRNKKIEKHAKSANNFKYSGDITIKLSEDNRVYKEANYHNTGCTKLFNFLADCLTGNFTAAISSRPCRIVLFKDVFGESDTSENSWSEKARVSTKVFYDTAITPGATTADGSTVTYHFRIPYICLSAGDEITKIALYPDNISNFYTDRCAYFILPEPIEIPTVSGNFTIIIDWKLHIYNAKKD